jgi:hypothetical protein
MLHDSQQHHLPSVTTAPPDFPTAAEYDDRFQDAGAALSWGIAPASSKHWGPTRTTCQAAAKPQARPTYLHVSEM